MTDWVPGDWGNVTAGDRVRLEAADAPALAGTIQTINHKQGHRIGVATEIGWKKTETWQNLGWNLFVPVPTQPELPTVPGFYADKERDLWILNNAGEWECVATPFLDGNPRAFAPFTRLLPEAETARRIIERIDTMRSMGDDGTLTNLRSMIVAEFGVTLD